LVFFRQSSRFRGRRRLFGIWCWVK